MGATLHTPFALGALTLANRIVMAPMTRNRAGPGNVPQLLNVEYYRQRASAGIIIEWIDHEDVPPKYHNI